MHLKKRRRAPITTFRDEHEFLSNFHAGAPLRYGGHDYPTAEHLFQSLKTRSVEQRAKIRNARTPAGAKRAGRQVKLRDGWDEQRQQWMWLVLAIKFKDPTLRQRLLATGDALLVEGNTWRDTYWGQCPLGTGSNHLGKLLMRMRRRLRREV